ncbi:unnamed protein product [Periconia digitata]|uniref:NAD(P)-binding protein n=1 Tax=Periconia digitata TaxID=1303443 RepID=A0A9W4UPD3_9PLEO|nr:unnamed protein product [Periconia digitata]
MSNPQLVHHSNTLLASEIHYYNTKSYSYLFNSLPDIMSTDFGATDDSLVTNFTKVIHRKPYPAISPIKPSLSQAGRTVLITGGGVGIGKAIAHNFVLASAATIVIIGRRLEKLEETASELDATAEKAGKTTKIIARSCDVTDDIGVKNLWDDLGKKGVFVDVLVLNSATDTANQSLFELGIAEVWSQFEANVKGPLHFAECFHKQVQQGPKKAKYLVNVSSSVIHLHGMCDAMETLTVTLLNAYEGHPAFDGRPGYSVTKGSGTLAIQSLAYQFTPEEMQVINYHPGAIYGRAWKDQGVPEDGFDFDDPNLPGAFAVWAASRDASFLHGRYVFCHWDVEELADSEVGSRLKSDRDYLKLTVKGLNWMKKDF